MTQEVLIPLYCLSGFVGSGKTTVLLNIIRRYPEKKIGVIFAEPAIFAGESRDEDEISIDCMENGSLQCTCEEDALPRALEYMQQAKPEMVFVEVSGLSDPLHVQKILQSEENSSCLSAYDMGGIICLIDADNFMSQIKDVDMVKRQLSHCHMAVINKADLVSPELLCVLQAQIRRINPDCDIENCSFGGFSLDLLSHDLLSHPTDDGDGDANGRNPDSIVLNCACPLCKDKLLSFIERFTDETYRIKGFCLLENGWNQIDAVGSRLTLTPSAPRKSSRLIFISKIGHAISAPLTESWNELIGLPMELHD